MAAAVKKSVEELSGRPTSSGNWLRYRERVEHVIDYIHSNLAESLDSDQLAEIAHLSSYHWHRIYRAITGETAAATVRRARLNKAAHELLRSDKSIAAIGESVGYPEIHSFTRTFKSYYGVASGKFRQVQRPLMQKPHVEHGSEPGKDGLVVEIVEQLSMRLFGQSHTGDYLAIGATFEKVFAICAVEGVLNDTSQGVGVYFNDPDVVREEKLTSFAGVSVSGSVVLPDSLEECNLSGGRCAVLTHCGPFTNLEFSYRWLYGQWLPASGLSVRDLPCSEIYLNSPLHTAPDDLRTAIYLPIE